MTDPLTKIKENLAKAEECFRYQSELTAWEVSFLGTVISVSQRKIPLSEKQQNILDKLEQKLIERLD